MRLFLFAFLASLAVCGLLVLSSRFHKHLSGDVDQSKPQSFHAHVVPRVGGVGIMAGIVVGVLTAYADRLQSKTLMALLVMCGAVAFLAGVIEDLYKNVSPRRRLMATLIAAALAAWLLDAVIPHLDVPVLGVLTRIPGATIALSLLAVAGVANSVNIIDGFNGLASMAVCIMLTVTSLVASAVGDVFVLGASVIALGAVLGFFVLNFPLGKIFLGDGGAYLLGFVVAELNILLITRNPSVSPLLPLMVCAYPVTETLFSMYRRKIVRGRAVDQPDAGHLHSLFYRRVLKSIVPGNSAPRSLWRNSLTAPYLWMLTCLSAVPSVIFWDNSYCLFAALIGFYGVYLYLYRVLVKFRVPTILGKGLPKVIIMKLEEVAIKRIKRKHAIDSGKPA